MKVLVHDGIGIWLAARRLCEGHFIWPRVETETQMQISQVQFDALVLGLPWHRLGEAGIIKVL
jgi:transposase